MRAALLLVAVCVVAGGCAHVVSVESTPPGAAVIVDGRKVGSTPYLLEERTGGEDLVAVEVQHGGRAARFGYARTGVAIDAASLAAAGACALCAVGGLTVVLPFLAVPLVVVTATSPEIAGAALVGVYGAFLGGTLVSGWAPWVFVLGVGEGARKGPERIHVDFRGPAPVVTSEPAAMTVPFVGRTDIPSPGQRY